jgi:50S ribosomal protein L16 3-hydroxylase
MDINAPTALLGGLSPATFMRRHWQKRPLLVRQAWPGVRPPLPRAQLFALAAQDDVESRLVQRLDAVDAPGPGHWQVRHGPLPRRALPPLARPGWTLLVQGLDLHVPAAHALLAPFAFLPAARLDDLMVSWASDGGGVGPHLDSYDVFLLQVQGRRRWRVAPVPRAADAAWVPGAPLKILQRFEPTEEWVLEPGDMLYLPPRWAHDGVALGACMTCSIGLRAPAAQPLAAELLLRLADAAQDAAQDEAEGATDDATALPGARTRRLSPALYRDPAQPATAHPGAMPAALQQFAASAVQRLLAQPQALQRALGEVLTEPKPHVWFPAADEAALAPAAEVPAVFAPGGPGARLHAATRMLYDQHHVFINGESLRAGGRDARVMHALADTRRLTPAHWQQLGADARALVQDWLDSGWLQPAGHLHDDPEPGDEPI